MAGGAAGGFTLIEAMVAVAVMALFFAMISTILVSLLTTQDAVTRSLTRERIGAAVLELVGRDLQGVYAYEIAGAFRGTDGGQQDRLEMLTTRAPAFADEEDEDAAAAAAEDPEAALFSPNRQQPLKLTKVGYFLKSSAQSGLYTLFRYEEAYTLVAPDPNARASSAAAQSPFDDLGDEDSVHVFEVFDRVATFDVRFLDADGQWSDGWKEEATLPLAIELTLQIVPDIDAPLTGYETEFERLQRGTYRATYGLPIKLPDPDAESGATPR